MRYILLLLVGCVYTPISPVVIVFPPELLQMGARMGTVLCSYNNIPFVVLNPMILGTEIERLVTYHEQVHVRQLAEDCREKTKHYTAHPDELQELERVAYCLTQSYASSFEQTPLVIEYLLASAIGFEQRFGARLVCNTQGTAQSLLGINRGGG